jgi:hypothetical protein
MAEPKRELIRIRATVAKQLKQTSRVVASEAAVENILKQATATIDRGLTDISGAVRKLRRDASMASTPEETIHAETRRRGVSQYPWTLFSVSSRLAARPRCEPRTRRFSSAFPSTP